jgi:hypothetical protein
MSPNKWIVLLPMATLVGVGIVLQLPAVWQLPLLLVLLVGFIGFFLRQPMQMAWQQWRETQRELPPEPMKSLPRWQIILEIVFLAGVTLFFTQDLWRSDATMKLPGAEMEWLTGHVQVAHQALRDYGDIPLWNPYYRNGEPLIDNAFSFILNPLSSLPGLLLDVPQGIKYSVVFYAFFAALGGWFLAFALKLSLPARLLLGLMLLGKGNMTSMFLTGYYQLAVQQAYFAWIIAGTIATIKTRDRWAIILTGVMMALMFMAGNVWYILPMMVCIFVVTVAYSLPFWRDWHNIKRAWLRLMAAGMVTLSVSAVYTLPILAHYDHIGNHDDEIEAGWETVFRWRVPALFVTPDMQSALAGFVIYVPADNMMIPAYPHFYYSAVIPAWFVILIFVVMPPLYPYLHRPFSRLDYRRLWLAGSVLIVLMTMWGMGGTPLFEWLYANIAVLRGWRFVGRALAVASFWIAVLVALRVDALWRALTTAPFLSRLRRGSLIVFGVIWLAAGISLNHSAWDWAYQDQVIPYDRGLLQDEETKIPPCLQQLREQNPDAALRVWVNHYSQIEPFIRQRIRIGNIAADFLLLPDAYTIGDPMMDWWRNLPEYAMPVDDAQRQFLEAMGYQPYSDIQAGQWQCFYQHPTIGMPYSFALPQPVFGKYGEWEHLRPFIMPVLAVENKYDTIGVLVPAHITEQVLIVKETAYPGWTVTVNDVPAKLDITGGFMSVVLPAGTPTELYQVVFMYRPPLMIWGGAVTVLTIVLICGYLLRIDKPVFRLMRSCCG